MPKWEYCVIGPIKMGPDGLWEGFYPKLVYLSDKGRKIYSIEKDKQNQVPEADILAQTVAKLGIEGWELVNTGSVYDHNGSNFHYIYFKRMIQEEVQPY